MKNVLPFLGGLAAWAASNLGGALGFLPQPVKIGLGAVGGLLTVMGVRQQAVNPAQGFQHALDTMGYGWKTVTGCLLAAFGYLLSPDVLHGFSPGLAGTLQTIGTVLAALGVYHAVGSTALKAG